MRMFSEQARRARDRGWAWVLAAVAVAALVLPWAARASSCQADLNTSTIDPQILRDNQADASNQSVGIVWAMEFLNNGQADEVVLTLMTGKRDEPGGRLWRSAQNGAPGTWRDITALLDGALSADPKDSKGIYELVPHQRDSNRIIARGIDARYWVSDDAGASWTSHRLPEPYTNLGGEIYAHPYNPNMVAMLARRRDCAGAGQPEQKCPHTLLVHENFGHDDTQWRDLVALSDERIFGFLQFEWGALTVQHASDPSQLAQNRRILATVIVRKADKAAGSKLDPDEIQFVASDNYFDDPHELLLPCVTQFVVVDDNIAVAVPAQCAPDDAAALDKHHKHPIEPGAAVRNLVLFVSEDEGRTFQEACIPSMDMDMMFALYDLEGLGGTYAGLMLVTDHDEEDDVLASAPIGNAYVSGPAMAVLSNALRGVFWEQPIFGFRVTPDLTPVAGFPGTLIVNAIPPEILDNNTDGNNFAEYIQTWHTTSSGAVWTPLSIGEHAVPTFHDASCNRCPIGADGCSLHLHSSSGWFFADHPPLYAHPGAPGLVMGTGNYGDYLDYSHDAVCTYLSRDGGITWEDVRVGSWIYEYGDHGGVIVMGRHQSIGPADQLHFSLDYGRTWNAVQLTTAFNLDNIRLELGGRGSLFIAYGTTCTPDDSVPQSQTCTDTGNYPPTTVIYALDMDQMLKNWTPCLDSDYEMWTMPKTYTNDDGCLLGAKYAFHRRAEEACCQNTFDFKRDNHIQGKCRCSKLDLECDFGAYMVFNHTMGWPEGLYCRDDAQIPSSWCPSITNNHYHTSRTMLRLVAGDICDEATLPDYIDDTDGKGNVLPPHKGGRGGGGGGSAVAAFFRFLFILLLVLGLLAAAAFAVVRIGPTAIVDRTLAALSAAKAVVLSAFASLRGSAAPRRRSPGYYTRGLEPLGPDDDFAGAGTYQPMPAGPVAYGGAPARAMGSAGAFGGGFGSSGYAGSTGNVSNAGYAAGLAPTGPPPPLAGPPLGARAGQGGQGGGYVPPLASQANEGDAEDGQLLRRGPNSGE